MKKSLYVLALTLVAALNAGGNNSDCHSCGTVSVEHNPHVIDFQFRALILKPSSSNTHYAVEATTLPAPSPRWSTFDLHPKYKFGFDIGARTNFLNHCRSIGVNYERFNSKTSGFHVAAQAADMVGPFFEIGPEATPYQRAEARTEYNFNAVHVNVEQGIDFGNLETHFFGGINFTSLKQTTTTHFASAGENPNTTRTIVVPVSFKGAGPEFGVCAQYKPWCHVGLTGKSAVAVLVGHSKNNTGYSSVSPVVVPGLTYPNLQSVTNEKRTIVVPVLEQRLGASFEHDFWCHYNFRLEVGYEARIYINALQQIDMGSEVAGVTAIPASVGLFARTFQRNISNFALSGPYVACNIAF